MSNNFNKKLSDFLGKMDEKVFQAKVNGALDMLKNGNTDELAKKLSKVDKEDLLNKISEIDDSKLKNLNINKKEIQEKMSQVDLDSLKKLIGDHGDEIINKIKDIIK